MVKKRVKKVARETEEKEDEEEKAVKTSFKEPEKEGLVAKKKRMGKDRVPAVAARPYIRVNEGKAN